MEPSRITFHQFLNTAFEESNYSTDDVIAFVRPLFEEVLQYHEAGLVAPFEMEEALFITENRVDINELHAHSPSFEKSKLNDIFLELHSRNFDIISKKTVESDVDGGLTQTKDLHVHFNINEPLRYPAYLKGYNCFETILGHHDAQTDIFCLGLILGSIALGLNLYDEEDLQYFAEYRSNPVRFNERVHPTISTLITEMTELKRAKRSSDLYEVIHRLQHYREYDPEKQTDLSNVAGWVNNELKERSQFILNKLRNRLFDTSRRNRLLYYKPNMRFVNLTVSSVPMVLHYQSIRPDLLFTWNEEVSSKIIGQKEMVLNKYLRFEDHAYLASALDKARVESQRDIHEFGFSQLKLVICFLNWHNLKDDSKERIQSPLLLLPVELKKIKRIKEDHFSMKVLDNNAEVNPVLANQLRDFYGIKLPDFIDLDEMSLPVFYSMLKAQIDEANQGIQLHYIDKPKIKLVHSIAKQTITNYRKRLRKNGGNLESYKNISYSYQPEHYKPLGLEIFKQRIEPRVSYLEFLVNDDVKLSPQKLSDSTIKERELFEITESESNPYSWDFDLCNMVLGNFNYKKMSLVRDYHQVIEKNLHHDVFESLFSNLPKPIQEDNYNLNQVEEWNHVITADPTQTQAIFKSRTGRSFIIQGPPGTGKSQTITNLIADYVARGKSILFVCEKRAALDVVFHRLKQNNLDELCCYIHDSQGDKREFIKNLKTVYEDFSKNQIDVKRIEEQRNNLLKEINKHISLLESFHSFHISEPASAGIKVRELLEKIIELKNHIVLLEPTQQELLPDYHLWTQFEEIIRQLSQALEEEGASPSFAEHPLSKVSDLVFKADHPLNSLDLLIKESNRLLSQIKDTLTYVQIDPAYCNTLEQIKSLVLDSILLEPLAKHDNLHVLDNDKNDGKEFDKKIKGYKQLGQLYQLAQEESKRWKVKIPESDLDAAMGITQKNEKSLFGFLNGPWRKLKKLIKENYDFSLHQVKPSFVSILQQLEKEYAAAHTLSNAKNKLDEEYQLENIDITYLGIENVRKKRGQIETDYLLAHPDAGMLILSLVKLKPVMDELEKTLLQCLHSIKNKSIQEIGDELENAALNAEGLLGLLPALKAFVSLPDTLKEVFRTIPMDPIQAEASIANKTLFELYQQNKAFAGTNWASIEKAAEQIKQAYKQLLKLNALLIRSKIRRQFIGHVELSNTAISQLSPAQRQFKKNYTEGRKILENEFGKSMRYKSIRELSAKESGLVLKDIKPIWLMSPLSVSDSLPLDTSFFDVVIFDEASQITLEEGIPSLYRGPQTIIVGDDKQMPPTNFFTAKTEDPDDLLVFEEETEDEILSVEADSLLAQGTRKLDSTMLSWHYRSHYETLISYSNHAFYNAALLTIPDKTIHHHSKNIIEVNNPEDAIDNAQCLFDRSISFHFHPTSVYEKRNNQDEANYIASLIRSLLKQKVKDSIGIVAFSQEQQLTIEDALTALAQTDKEFEQLLEEAYNRTEKDQYVGLIVKNLENIQGDERDIIIMSVCYGFDTNKKILMNFGPINKKGGEKRLNVIFSRAKKHMAIISSIKYQHITNEYNEGANYFRRFLQYAEQVSNGNMQMARTILDSLVIGKHDHSGKPILNIVLKEIKGQLQALGFEVAEMVGQSSFKCSLAIKMKDERESYTLGILLDDDNHYNNPNLIEQYYQRPDILQSFGWKTLHVFAKDWLQNPDKMIELIVKRLHEEPVLKNTTNESIESFELVISKNSDKVSTDSTSTNSIPGFDGLEFERFVFSEAGSNKFWKVGVRENKMVVRFGKIGTKGQVQIKSFNNAEIANNEKEKAVREKLGKGYVADRKG